MTALRTVVDRIRRAANGPDPERDIAVVLSEFVDEGGLEPVDDPFHPAQRRPATGPAVTIDDSDPLIELVRGTRDRPPSSIGTAAVVLMLQGTAAVELYRYPDTDSDTIADSGDAEGAVGPPELTETIVLDTASVNVVEADVVHRLRVDDGVAIVVTMGDSPMA